MVASGSKNGSTDPWQLRWQRKGKRTGGKNNGCHLQLLVFLLKRWATNCWGQEKIAKTSLLKMAGSDLQVKGQGREGTTSTQALFETTDLPPRAPDTQADALKYSQRRSEAREARGVHNFQASNRCGSLGRLAWHSELSRLGVDQAESKMRR